jgi:hypothetical protein
MEATLDGNLSLEQQRLNISGTEQAGPFFLVKLIKGDPKPQNNVSFVDVPLGQAVPELVFIEVKPTDSIDAISATQKTQDRKLICCNPMFVNGKETKVAAFR